jgi:integrase
MITPGVMYPTSSFCNAVKRACRRAGVAWFTPYDLRRSAATRVRAVLGKDAARLLLGHVSTDTTDIYLLEEVQEAIRVAKKLHSLSSRHQ